MANNLTRIKNNQVTDRTLSNVKIALQTLTGDLFNPDITLNSNVTISGNLTVSGNVTSVQSTSTQITDPLIAMGIGNSGTSYDEGLIFTRGGTGNYFLGWKENLDELVFINTSETGSTTGNIATTAYGNVRFGNSNTLGTGVVGLVSMSSGTVTTTSGNLTLTSTAGNVNVTGGMTVSGNIVASNFNLNGGISGGAINNTIIGNTTPASGQFTTLGATSTLNVAGTATVNALVSNGAISGTTGTFTGAVAGTSTANFAGTATVNALVSNGAISGTTGTFTSALGTTSTLSVNSTATVNALVSNTTISGTQITGTNGLVLNTNATITTDQTTANLLNTTATTVNFAGAATTLEIGAATGTTNVNNNLVVSGTFVSSSTATVNSLVSNGNVSGTNASFTGVVGTGNLTTTGWHNISANLNTGGTATVNALVSNGAISGTTGTYTGALATTSTLNAAGTATLASLVTNTTATVGTTLTAYSGVQNTPIGNATANTGQFTTLGATSTLNVAGTATVNALVSNGAISGTTGTYTGAVAGTSTANFAGTATVNALVSNGAISGTTGTYTGALATTSTLNAAGTATVNALVSNGAISGTTGTFTGNVSAGNLHVNGTLTYINSTTLEIVDPIIELNQQANGAPLSTDNNYDSGVRTHYYDTADRSAFFGRTDDTGYFEYYSNVTSETTGVIAGTYGTIKSGNLIMTGTGSFGSTLNASGTATVNALVSNGAISGTTGTYTGNIYTSGGNIYAPSGNITAQSGYISSNLTVLGNIIGSVTVVGNTGTFYGNATTGLEAFYAGLPTGYTILPNVVAQFTTNVNNYSQINAQNLSSGTQASTDLVLTANNGDDTHNYLDLGIASNNYAYVGYSGYGPNDGYLLIDGGNLLLNVESPSKTLKFIVGGYSASNLVGDFSNTRLAVNVTTTSTNSTNGALVVAGGVGVAGAINGGSTLNIVGAATVNSLTSNGAISGTTGTYTGALATTSTLNSAGTATVNSLVSNGAISGTTGTFTAAVSTANLTTTGWHNISANLNTGGTATVNALVSNGAISGTTGTFTGAVAGTSTANFAGTATVNALVSNGAISGTTGTYTGAVAGTSTANFAGVATLASLVTNTTATIGTTLTAYAGVQNTPIGNATANTGAFTTLTASGATTLTGATASTAYSNGVLIVTGGVGIAGNLNVSGTSYANLANIQISGNTITSITTNGNVNIDANGTGAVVVNSAQDSTKFIVKGNTANANVGNLLTVSTSTNQIGVRQSTFIDGAALQINSTDSLLLPVGAQGDRPGTPVAGMLRFSTTAGSVEWYTGTDWGTASTQFTIVQANTATGDGSTTNFTLPVSNASTAGTIVSINGIVQKPVDAYGISGSTLAFTEAPAVGDVIDIRAFTTTVSVTSLVDAVGTTGVFMDNVVGDQTITFKNDSVTTATIDPNGYLNMKANGFIVSTPSVTAAASATTIDSFAKASYRAAKYLVTARNSGSTQWTTLEALVVHDGTTATITTYGIVNTGATTQITIGATISGSDVLVQATGAAAGTVVNFEKTYIVGS